MCLNNSSGGDKEVKGTGGKGNPRMAKNTYVDEGREISEGDRGERTSVPVPRVEQGRTNIRGAVLSRWSV